MGVTPPRTLVPQAALALCLRELPNCVVLRNEEDLFDNLQRGGDVDLLVADLQLAERTLIRHFGSPVRIFRSSYATGYSYDWGHLDLLPTVEWRGACYLRTEAVLESRQLSASGRGVPRIAHEAVISWLTSLLWGGFFNERYASVIRQAAEVDGVAFRQALIDAAGEKWGLRLWRAAVDRQPEISAGWAHPLRRAVWWRACFRAPVYTIRRFLAFVIGQLRLRFAPPVPWIAILHPDGRQEPSIADVVDRFAACPYACVKALTWRPRFSGRAHGSEPTTAPLGGPRRGSIGGLRLLALATEWLVHYWARLVHLRARGYVLASDGMYFDAIVDFARDRPETAPRLVRALWWLLPTPDLVFLLDSETEVLEPPGHDASQAEIERRRHAYRALVRRLPTGHVLNGRLPLNTLTDEMQQAIRAWMLDRSVVSLGGALAPVATASTAGDRGLSGAPTLLSRGDGTR